MKRHKHLIDEYVRRLPLVSDDQVQLLSSDDAKQALFQEITTMTTVTDPRAPARPTLRPGGRVPRRAFLLAAVLGVLSLAGAAVALLNSTEAATSVGCHFSKDSVTVIDAVTGDPVADCAHEWRHTTGGEPPALTAYDNGQQGIAVVPQGWDVPHTWRRLEPGVAQDTRLIELDAALNDAGSGLTSTCHRVDEARTVAQRELDRLDLEAWDVVAERGEADGQKTCTYYFFDPARQRVVLIPMQGIVAPDDAPASVLASRLRDALEDDCLSLTEAADTAQKFAADAGIGAEALVLHEIIDADASCARAHVNVGGRVEVSIRGPDSR